MNKAQIKEGFIVELPQNVTSKLPFKKGDWLVVKLLNGKEVILEKPKADYWEENFAWGKEFAKERKITQGKVLTAIKEIRAGK